MSIKIKEYPCVKIGGRTHITVSGHECACGKRYEYAKHIVSKDTLIVKSPLLWLTISEISCPKCREIAEMQEAKD